MVGMYETVLSNAGFHRYGKGSVGYDRQNSVGWMGVGGAVFQWHCERQVGFAFTSSLLLPDFANSDSAILQNEVLNCAKRLDEAEEGEARGRGGGGGGEEMIEEADGPGEGKQAS